MKWKKLVAAGGSSAKVAIVNLANEPEYGNICTGPCLPTLTRGSAFFDLVSNRSLTLSEAWTALGFPHPDAEIGDTRRFFPFDRDFLSRLSSNEVRSCLGNAMHVMQIGAWFLFNVGYAAKR